MENDRRVASLKNSDVRWFAKKLRDFFGVKDASRIDVMECLRSTRIWTVRGERALKVQTRPKTEMGGADGRTTSKNGNVLIEIEQSVFERAKMGEGRARNTIAHELGHAVLHEGFEMPRLATNNVSPGWLPPYESAEHQVKVFAPAFLINDEVAEALPDAAEVSVVFGISCESADIYFSELIERRERGQIAKKFRAFADEFSEKTVSTQSKTKFLAEPCTNCGSQTVFPVGTKFMCQKCNALYDRLQDGDPGDD